MDLFNKFKLREGVETTIQTIQLLLFYVPMLFNLK